jgi:hypothetical protein
MLGGQGPRQEQALDGAGQDDDVEPVESQTHHVGKIQAAGRMLFPVAMPRP